LRQALGLDSWQLLGISYGTEVVNAIAARYPKSSETVFMDCTMDPVGLQEMNTWAPTTSKGFSSVVKHMFERCNATEKCSGDGFNMEDAWSQIMTILAEGRLSLKIEVGGKEQTLQYSLINWLSKVSEVGVWNKCDSLRDANDETPTYLNSPSGCEDTNLIKQKEMMKEILTYDAKSSKLMINELRSLCNKSFPDADSKISGEDSSDASSKITFESAEDCVGLVSAYTIKQASVWGQDVGGKDNKLSAGELGEQMAAAFTGDSATSWEGIFGYITGGDIGFGMIPLWPSERNSVILNVPKRDNQKPMMVHANKYDASTYFEWNEHMKQHLRNANPETKYSVWKNGVTHSLSIPEVPDEDPTVMKALHGMGPGSVYKNMFDYLNSGAVSREPDVEYNLSYQPTSRNNLYNKDSAKCTPKALLI
jgi:hypothetical protein